MKKLSMVVLLGLALSAVVSGCNNSDSTTTPPAVPGTNSMPATPAMPATNAAP